MTKEEEIEQSLGKDRLPNLHWKAEIPTAWSIISRPEIMLCSPDMASSTITLNEGIPYKFNNLGYRTNFDYDVGNLKKQNVILLLGDSDTIGRGVDYNDMYATKLSNLLPDYCVVNLGVASISSDGIARIGTQSILALGSAIKHVCVLWPIFSNREFVSKKFASGIHVASKHIPYTDWYSHIDWVSNNYNYQKNRILLEQTTMSNGAEYHDLMINRYDKNSPVTYNLVRSTESDINKETVFTEFSSDSHTAIANYFAKKINNQPILYKRT